MTLLEFLDETGLEVEDGYAGNRTWSELREAASLGVAPAAHTRPRFAAESRTL